ncbi:MAG: hypothetical protein LBG47_11065 [Prevotellaceae bacterium]|nr:hypothetical protein [Prevotellaceae bacterium]
MYENFYDKSSHVAQIPAPTPAQVLADHGRKIFFGENKQKGNKRALAFFSVVAIVSNFSTKIVRKCSIYFFAATAYLVKKFKDALSASSGDGKFFTRFFVNRTALLKSGGR